MNILQPYESYQTTELPWLPTIPNHWKLARNKNFMTESKATVGDKSSDYTLLSLTINGVIARDVESGKGKFPKDFNTYKIVEENDIIFCLFDIDETPRTVGLSSLNGMITGAYNVFKIKGINRRFLYYYYLSLDNVKALRPLYTGLRKVINVPIFNSTKLPVPPQSEQDQIVRYLDNAVTKINKFIRAKKKQISLLTEYKNARINQAVTKGINPNADFKDSGIEWIGDIPAHWDIKYLFQIASEQTLSNKTIHNQNLLSLSYGKIVKKDINTTEGLLPASFDSYQIVHDGNIVLRLTDLQNDHKSLRVGLATQTGIITSAYTCLKTRSGMLPQYLYLLLHSFDICKVFYGMGGGVRQSIGYAEIRKMQILQPPINEQQAIVDLCYKTIEKTDRMIEALKQEISLMDEFKIRLISDVVTGKVDVRNIKVDEIPQDDDIPDVEELDDESEVEDDSEETEVAEE